MRLFGHPVHPMLVHLPLALWIVGTACEGLALLGVTEAWRIGWLSLSLGVAAAVPAMAAGLADFRGVPEAAVATATRHMLLMGSAWAAYLAALLLGSDGFAPHATPQIGSVVASLVGLALLIAGAAHGGQLVYQHGVGVEGAERKIRL